MIMRDVMALMSDPMFGEDETEFFKRQMRELKERCIPLPTLRDACRMRFKQLEVGYLLDKIEQGHTEARDRALVLLLKEVFFI